MTFNLQIFGSNDTVTSSRELKLDYAFTDADTRLISLPNPKSSLTSDDIVTAATVLKETNAFVGDKYGGAFSTIRSAQIVEATRTYLDLS